MLACVDIYKLEYTLLDGLRLLNYASNSTNPKTKFMVTPQQMSMQQLPMTLFCKMTNTVNGEGGELIKYRHLIARPNTQATWTHSYGNKIVCLAKGMSGCNTSRNTIYFIQKNQVPKERAKDMAYGLITVLIQPEKMDKPNRTRLVAGGNRVNCPGHTGTPTSNLLTSSS